MSARAKSPPAATRPAPKGAEWREASAPWGRCRSDTPGGSSTAMSARAKSPPPPRGPRPKARSGARHPPLGGGDRGTIGADLVGPCEVAAAAAPYADGFAERLGKALRVDHVVHQSGSDD